MAQFQTKEVLVQRARISIAPVRVEQATAVDHPERTFEMPTGLYAATAACYLGFIGMMALGFSSPGLILPMAIFAIFIAMFFAVPFAWTRMQRNESDPKARGPLSWDALKAYGIQTNTGRLSGSEAAVQMMILPVLVVIWGVAVLAIAAVVT